MPTYNFRDNETGEEFEIQMRISELDEYKKNNPNLTQFLTGAPAVAYDSAGLSTKGSLKTDDNFNSLLKHIKKGNSKGMTKSTINTR